MSYKRMRPGYEDSPVMRMRALTDEQCELIISSAAKILAETGIEVQDDEIRDLLVKAGCTAEGSRVRVPESVLKDCLEKVPSEIKLYDREGKEALLIRGYNTYYGPGLCNTLMVDTETGQRRESTKEDAKEVAILCDALPNIDFVYGLVGIMDCPAIISELYELSSMLQYTTKPLAGWNNSLAGCQDTLDMCVAVAGSLEKLQEKPFIFMYAGNPVAPFVHPKEYLDKLKFWVDHKIPVIYPTGTQLGINGPVTMAGALVSAMADDLAGVVITQVLRPGAPFMGNSFGIPLDMRTMHACYGAPEMCLNQVAQADLHHYLAIPTWSIGGCSDSKVLDEQAALEVAMTMAFNEAGGNNLCHDLGFLEGGLIGSKELLVLGDEIAGYLRRIMRGIEFDEESLALDLIQELGPGGRYMSEDHTVENFREVVRMSDLLDHRRYSAWQDAGAKSMGERLNDKVKAILANHQPKALDADIVQKLEEILARAEKRAANA